MAPVGKANALPVIIVGLIVCGLPAYALATLFGAGSVAMIAMMVSLFTFISITGGSLLADMKTAAAVSPLIFVAATVPRLVSEWNAVAGAVAACACMLVVALLPLHDEQLGNARMGSGMAVIFSYAMTLPGEFDAARTFVGMSVMIALTTAVLPAGSSLKASALLCTFAILQSSWYATLAKSKARIIGVSAGMVVSAVLTAVLPAHIMLPVAMVCQLLGMWFMLSNPALAYFFMAVMSIGMAVGTRGVDPGSYIVEYLVVIAAAIVVGVIRGFAVVRPVPHPTVRESVETVWNAVLCVLETLRDNADRPIVLTEAFTEYSAATGELRREHAGGAADAGRRERVEQFALACFDLVLCGIDYALNGKDSIGDFAAQVGGVSFDALPGGSPHGDRRVASDLVTHAQRIGAELCASSAGTCRSQAREANAGEEGPRSESSATASEQERE